MKNILLMLGVILLCLSCQNQTSTTSNPNQVGTIEANDSKSTAARDFSNAYTSNNLLSAKSLFTEDAVFKINDAEMSFDDMAAGFNVGHNFFDNIRNDDKHIYTMHYDKGDNAGKTYTNMWYVWKGIRKDNGKELIIKGYAYFAWRGDKVYEMYNAFDPTLYTQAILEQQ
jgi:hypothetical protein